MRGWGGAKKKLFLVLEEPFKYIYQVKINLCQLIFPW